MQDPVRAYSGRRELGDEEQQPEVCLWAKIKFLDV